MHKESSHGQFEISIKYDEVFRSIDNYHIARMTIQKHFEKKGLKVTYLPKIDKDQTGSGAHVHLSLWKVEGLTTPVNVTGDEFSMFKMSEAF